MIDLQGCLTVKSAEEKTGKAHSFEVSTPDQTFYLVAEDESQKDLWISSLGRAIVRYSSSHIKDESGDSDDDDEDE